MLLNVPQIYGVVQRSSDVRLMGGNAPSETRLRARAASTEHCIFIAQFTARGFKKSSVRGAPPPPPLLRSVAPVFVEEEQWRKDRNQNSVHV